MFHFVQNVVLEKMKVKWNRQSNFLITYVNFNVIFDKIIITYTPIISLEILQYFKPMGNGNLCCLVVLSPVMFSLQDDVGSLQTQLHVREPE